MIRKMIKALILIIACIAFVSCSGNSRNLMKNKMVDSLTNQDFSSSSSNNESNNESSNIKGNGSKSKSKYSGGATGDEQYVDDDVVFVSQEAFKGSSWIRVSPAKVVAEPSAKTKNEGQFMIISSGEEMWTKNFWKTRIAKEKELKVGLIVIICERTEDEIYLPPTDKSQVFSHSWFMAKITDMSDKYRGYITVSGNFKVSPDNMRLIIK